MRLQLAYRATGEDPEKLSLLLSGIKGALEASGNSVWVPALDTDKPTSIGELFSKTFKKLDECDALLAIVSSDAKSEGMLMEVGYAIARGKRICLAVQKDVKTTHLRDLADMVVEFSDYGELRNKLSGLRFD